MMFFVSSLLSVINGFINNSLFFDISGYDCGGTGVLSVIKFVWQLLDIVLFIVPIGLILMLSIDISKCVIAGKVDDMRKNFNLAIKRLVLCVVLFLVEPIVQFSVVLLGNMGINYATCLEIAVNDNIYQYKVEVEDEDYSNIKAPDFERNPVYGVGGGKLELTEEDYKHLENYRQYGGKYDSKIACKGSTVAGTACGMCSYMAARYVLTKEDTDFMGFVHEACNTGFHNGLGATWDVVASDTYEKKYGIKSVKMKKSYSAIVEELKKGNVVVVLDHAGYATTSAGGFNGTPNGHFIAIVDYDSSNGKVYVFNPTGANTGWTSKEVVNNYVVKHALIMRSMQKLS